MITVSRIGRLPIVVPQGVAVNIKEGEVAVKGPKGELLRAFNKDMAFALNDNVLVVSRPSDSRSHRSLHGLTRTLLANMVEGVSKGYEKTLEVVGVGYRVEKQGDKVMLRIGFSHLVEVAVLPGDSGQVLLSRFQSLGIRNRLSHADVQHHLLYTGHLHNILISASLHQSLDDFCFILFSQS